MPPKARYQHAPDQTCIRCKTRKKHKSWPYCPSCRALLIADGVIKPKKGVPLAVRWKQYCDMFGKGMTQLEIAHELGLNRSYISNFVKRCRDQGWPVPSRAHGAQKITVHGGGSAGIRGCSCELCLAKRREYKAQWHLARQAKIAAGQPMELRSKTQHGEGTRGVKDCKCELCLQRRRDYKREWEAYVKANGYKRKKPTSVAQRPEPPTLNR